MTSTIAAPFSGDIDLGGGKLIVEYSPAQAGTAALTNWPMAEGEKFPVNLATNFIMYAGTEPSRCARVPVITIPTSVKVVTADDFVTTTSTKEAADFDLPNDGHIAGIHFEVETSGDIQTVYIARKYYLLQAYGMNANGAANASSVGAWNGWDVSWSGTLGVLDNTSYVNVSSNFLGVYLSANPLRTPANCYNWTLSTDPRASLTMLGTTSQVATFAQKVRNLTVPNLVLGPKSALVFWATAKSNPPDSKQFLHGNIIIETKDDGNNCARIACGSTADNDEVCANISGNGYLQVDNATASLNPSLIFSGDNSGYKGRFRFVGSSGKPLKIQLADSNSLGGSSSSSIWGVTLEYTPILVTNDCRFVCGNRTLVVKVGGGEISVPAGKTFEYCAPYVFENTGITLKKTGAGTLDLPSRYSSGTIGKFYIYRGKVATDAGYLSASSEIAMESGNLAEVEARDFIPGTHALKIPSLPADGKAKLILAEGTLNDGAYTIITSDGTLPSGWRSCIEIDASAVENCPALSLFTPDGKTVKLLAGGYAGPDCIWTGEGDGASLSDSANWLGGLVPSAGGETVMFPEAAGSLVNDLQSFAPRSITFGATIASGLEISGADITGVAAVTNLSATVSPVMNAAVRFAGDINVSQNAMTFASIESSHVVVTGGAYAADGCSLGLAASGWSQSIFGRYFLANENGTALSGTDTSVRIAIADSSTLYVPKAGNLTEIYVGTDGKVDVGRMDMTVNSRISWRNYGEIVVTNLFVSGGAGSNCYMTYNQGLSKKSVFKFETITHGMTENFLYFIDGNAASTNEVFIGEGGLTFAPGVVGGLHNSYGFGSGQVNCLSIVRPWYSDFTIHDKNNGKRTVLFQRDVEINTTDEGGTGRTITMDAISITASAISRSTNTTFAGSSERNSVSTT